MDETFNNCPDKDMTLNETLGDKTDVENASGSTELTLEEMRKRRKPVQRYFTRLENELLGLAEASKPDLDRMIKIFREFLQVYDDLAKWNDEILRAMLKLDVSEEDEDLEYKELSDFRSRAELVRTKINGFCGTNASATDTNQETQVKKYNLPKVELEKFSGDIKDWLRFWAQFRMIDEDRALPTSNKFWYLLQSLQKGSEAYEVVAAYPQSEDNYVEAVGALKRRYGNEGLLLQVYIREMLSLVIANVSAKQKMPFHTLYVKLDSYIRALGTLNLAKADPATWLFPLVEAALPEDVLYNWQRSTDSGKTLVGKNQLDILLEFMSKEVDIKQRKELTKTFTNNLKGVTSDKPVVKKPIEMASKRKFPSTTMGFHVQDASKQCVFCGRTNHVNKDCRVARSMPYEDKMSLLKAKGLCFICTFPHRAADCRNKDKIKCFGCGKAHLSILCKEMKKTKEDGAPPEKKRRTEHPNGGVTESKSAPALSNQVSIGDVCLQTLRVFVNYNGRQRTVRVFLDTGSSRSYILKRTAKSLGMIPHSEEKVIHSLFGGTLTNIKRHVIYNVELEGIETHNKMTVSVRDEEQICASMHRIDKLYKILKAQLTEKGITLSDVGDAKCHEIEVLIGADHYGKVVTGAKLEISGSLTALETIFGWTLIGVAGNGKTFAKEIVTMTVTDSCIKNLWELDLLGIRDSLEVTSEKEKELNAKIQFMKNVTRKPDGRYVVKLPWKTGHPPLPSNEEVALKRLESTSKKLNKLGMLTTYNRLFRDWETESFIEKCRTDEMCVHYLPHRAVVKPESLTTPVRPVFDASCKVGGNVSLNDCLHKGPSYIQLIPEVLVRFREKNVAFVSDIRKAFQMIEIEESDRDVLRFLWWKDRAMNKTIKYRHERVPFGLTSSPFILGAILEYHLDSVPEDESVIAKRLWHSLYVDNCCSSENTYDEYKEFRHTSVKILAEAKMDLRMWLSNVEDLDNEETHTTPVLGLKWDRKTDRIFLDMTGIESPGTVTKRSVLSTVSKIFDPVGFSSPAILPMKLLLQRAWISKIKWDAELPLKEANEFSEWCADLHCLREISLPRCIAPNCDDHSRWELHIMADGSKTAYGAVCYLRTKIGNEINVALVAAKSRVAPSKVLTIPRMELLACLIAVRMAAGVKTALKLENLKEFYWTDSTTALAWINRNDQWGTFVGNRTAEIVKMTKQEDWRHLPGIFNPADLPSRGCSPRDLLQTRWWEGPDWLKKRKEEWPCPSLYFDETEIGSERKKQDHCVTTLSNVVIQSNKDLSFNMMIRIQAWVRRFVFNCRNKSKRQGRLVKHEQDTAEVDILLGIQREAFGFEKGQERLKTLQTITDDCGVIRIQTRLTYTDDEKSFKYPVVLPGEHPLIRRLIYDTHQGYCHAGVGFVMVILRRKYWILKARQSLKKVIGRCYRCRKYSAKATVTKTAPLPLDRIKSAEVFEVTGVDLAGPFLTKAGKKVWLVLYTCAVYRAVHIQVINSLSTVAFIKSLKRFIDRYRRPAVIYSDNGTNFRGADHLFRTLDWAVIQGNSLVTPIEWKFNPPTAAWWGGWWERLIRTMKDLLRKEIGNVMLSQQELQEVVKTVEEVMNSRPLTYVSENPEDLEPLTPLMFMNPLGQVHFPEVDHIDGLELRSRHKYITMMKQNLKQRFKKEYISLLIAKGLKKPTRPLKVGELVIIAHDNKKRSQWPLGRVLELYAGRDGVERVAKVKTREGVMTRPVQRLHALEADQADPVHSLGERMTSRGRKIKLPDRFQP